MQLTIQQLKTAVLEHVSADWVRENFGKLTLKSTWQKAYDRALRPVRLQHHRQRGLLVYRGWLFHLLRWPSIAPMVGL
jgi:hypothetical protein